MRYLRYIALMVLLVALLPTCKREEIEDTLQSDGRLSLSIKFPARQTTKGDAYLPAGDEENVIHSLRIWVYDEENGTLVTPMLDLHDTDGEWDYPQDGGVKEFSLPVSWSFVLNPPRVRVYVLANAESIGFSLPENYTMQDLNDMVFGTASDENDGPFGVTSLVREVPATGLPMSGLKTGMIPSGVAPLLKLETITVQRMVSRIRLVFCKVAIEAEQGEDVPDVSITDITFGKNRIPRKEYLFTESATGICMNDTYEADNNYVQKAFKVDWPAGVPLCAHDTPEDFIYINQDPQSYESLLNSAVSQNHLTDLGYIYLRETDRKIYGTVNYQVTKGGKTESHWRDFSMSNNNDFARNHTWTLFAYYLNGSNINLTLTTLPWDKTDYDVEFSNQGVTVTRKLEVDDKTVELTLTSKDHYNAKLLPGVVAHAKLWITAPVNGTLYIKPVGASKYFVVSTDREEQVDTYTINPSNNAGQVDIYIRPSSIEVEPDDEGTLSSSIVLSFSVEVNDRYIDADTEAIDQVYRFYR